MTDNRTTELLRKLLDERGVDWRIEFDGATEWESAVGDYSSAVDVGDGKLVFTGCLTPEQAIAATLGNEYHGYEQAAIEAWKSIKAWNQRHVETCRITASATDGLCTDRPRQYFELSCGHSFTLDGLEPPNCCPNCGRKVLP